MLKTSLRRVARPHAHAAAAPCRPTPPSIASSTGLHQRRHSSSKPPVPPNNGSAALPAASVKQVGTPRSETKTPGTEGRLSRKRTTKDKPDAKHALQHDWTSNLPSVPSLQHLNPKDIYVASFFSTHRPLSITGPVPLETSIEAVDKIFQPRPKTKPRTPQDVIYTLASAVENIDEQIATRPGDDSTQNAEQKAAILKTLLQRNEHGGDPTRVQHLDGKPQSIHLQGGNGNVRLVIQEIARRFRPFNAPPAPTPMADPESLAIETDAEAGDPAAATAEAHEEMQAQVLEVEIERQDHDPYVQQVFLNVPHDAEIHDHGFFTSHGSPVVEIVDPSANHAIPKPVSRRRRPGYGHTGAGMYVISVKRQRRLKMKKHKYKKLMRKTRNLRRRLGQL